MIFTSRSRSTPLEAATRRAAADGGRRAVLAGLAILLVGAAAQLSLPIPGTPVPIALHDLAVLVVGVTLGPVTGAAAMVGYLLAGAAGAPVFSNGHGGLPWLLGPTGGYLLAYPAAAWIVGWAHRASRRWWSVLPGALAAQAAVFLGGVAQLLVLTGQGVEGVVALGVVPFLPGVALKTALLVGFVVALERLGPGASPGGGPSQR